MMNEYNEIVSKHYWKPELTTCCWTLCRIENLTKYLPLEMINYNHPLMEMTWVNIIIQKIQKLLHITKNL